MTLLSTFAVLLSRYSGQDDIVVGSPIANRREAQLEDLVGFFVNSLVMRVRLNSQQSFHKLLADVRKTALEAYQHQDVPFERLVEVLSPERSLNKTPIFQVVFALQNAPMGNQQLSDLKVERIAGDELCVGLTWSCTSLNLKMKLAFTGSSTRDCLIMRAWNRWRGIT